jgi:pyruvate dehydrogenase complex dehydrogenase (E1) component
MQDIELQEWIESLQAVIDTQGKERASEIINKIIGSAQAVQRSKYRNNPHSISQ